MLNDEISIPTLAALIVGLGLFVTVGTVIAYVYFRRFLAKPPTDLDFLPPEERAKLRAKQRRENSDQPPKRGIFR